MNLVVATLVAFVFLPSTSQATIYIDAIDRDAIGMAVITSGPVDRPNRILSAEKGVGIVGWGGAVPASPRDADSLIFNLMKRSVPPESVQKEIYGLLGDGYYRVSFISARNGIGFVLPPSGCREQECGFRMDDHKQFLIIGGGLESGVLERASTAFKTIKEDENLPFPCKLLSGIAEIVREGGEKKTFTSAQIVVDDPKLKDVLMANSLYGETGSETEILATLGKKLEAAGFACPSL